MRVKRVLIITSMITVLFAVAIALVSCTNYEELLNANTTADAGVISSRIQEMGVLVRVDGTRILVPKAEVSELRAVFASEGITGVGNIDLTLKQNASGFGATEERARELYEQQIAQELRAAILTSPEIQDALVVLNLGESAHEDGSLSSRDPSVSVLLTIADNSTLTSQEAIIQGIAEIIRNSVPGIKNKNITITDSNLNIYAIVDGNGDVKSG